MRELRSMFFLSNLILDYYDCFFAMIHCKRELKQLKIITLTPYHAGVGCCPLYGGDSVVVKSNIYCFSHRV